MKLIFFKLIVLFLILNTVSGGKNNEFFKKSIFKALKKKNGQFKTRIDWIIPKYKDENFTILENYDYEYEAGEFYKIWYSKDKNSFYDKTKIFYLMESKEYYNPFEPFNCFSFNLNQTIISSYLTAWAPKIVYNKKLDYKTIGPTALFEVLLENYDKDSKKVECTDKNEKIKKCSIKFNNQIRLKYYFSKKDDYSMLPLAIFVLEKKKLSWNLIHQFSFTGFKAEFGEKPILNFNLPIGYGCRRLNAERYPEIDIPNYGKKFKITYDFVFNYFETKNNANGHDTYNFTNVFTRSVTTNQIYIDAEKNPTESIIDTIDEDQNKTIRLVYNNPTKFYNFNSDKCSIYDLKNYYANWFYIHELFLFNPQIVFGYKNNYSFIGQFKIDKIKTFVFENRFRVNYTEIKFNDSSLHLINKNHIRPNHLIVQHYYAKDKRYWTKNTKKLLVPYKIDIQFYDELIWKQIGNFTMNIKSYESDPKETPKYEMDKCENI